MSKSLKIFLVSCSVMLSFSASGQVTVHDFDSLVEHNEAFALVAEQIGDTLDLFNSYEPLEVMLESDFKNLAKHKNKEEYQDATFSVMYNDSVRVVRTIKIKARGNMRKKTCHIPPIKLNFPKKDAFIDQLSQFDKLKMVLDCKRGNIYEQYLLSEYYAYKIQNLVTDYSLRVRLLHVTYNDTGGRYKTVTKYAFIIESIDQINKRLNTMRLESKGVRDIRTNHKVLTEAYLFQYLIGNTDWSIPGLHNMYILKSLDPTVVFPCIVPFDFDYAGIVNANYAVPNEDLNIENVRERLYRGVCVTDNEIYQARDHFLALKPKIYALYENDQYMTKSNKSLTLNYIDEFYQIMEKEGVFKREIIGNCR